MRIRLPTLNLFYYPDLAVTCAQRDHNSNEDFILQPKLIIEVLSGSTEAFDRGDKFSNYKAINNLEEYLLIHQDQILVEQFQRKLNNLWVPNIYRSGENLMLTSINYSLQIEALYENITQLL